MPPSLSLSTDIGNGPGASCGQLTAWRTAALGWVAMSETTTSGRLLRARPTDVGVPPAAVHAVLDDLERRGLEMHSLMVVRHGHVAAEGWWAPYSADRVHLLYSLSKSFTSTAVGFAVAEGRFRLDDRVVDLLPAHVPDDVDPA